MLLRNQMQRLLQKEFLISPLKTQNQYFEKTAKKKISILKIKFDWKLLSKGK